MKENLNNSLLRVCQYSFSQDCIMEGCESEKGIRENYVLTKEGWKKYSEWCSNEDYKCNWEDAELVYETNDNPEIKIIYKKKSILVEFEEKIKELEQQIIKEKKEYDFIRTLYQNCLKENIELKQNCYEYCSEIVKLKKQLKGERIEETTVEMEILEEFNKIIEKKIL